MMKNITYTLTFILMTLNLSAAYKVGEVVQNLTWTDSNLDQAGEIVTTERSVYNIIDEGKVLLIDFGFTT